MQFYFAWPYFFRIRIKNHHNLLGRDCEDFYFSHYQGVIKLIFAICKTNPYNSLKNESSFSHKIFSKSLIFA